MPLTHLLLAFAVVFIWGSNFPLITWGLADFPPFLFATLRFALSALPWIAFIARPAAPWRTLALLGLLLGTGQFGLVYWAMQRDISPGLTALVVQSQVFFTIVLAVLYKGERLRRLQMFALLLAATGYAVVAWRSMAEPSTTVTFLGLAAVLGAALCWACNNLLLGTLTRSTNMLAILVWASLYAVPPLLLLSLWLEGAQLADALIHAGPLAWGSALWQAWGNNVFCFAAWGWLLVRHPASVVLPMALLVPIIGLLSSVWLTNETLPLWKTLASVLVLAGLGLNVLALRRRP